MILPLNLNDRVVILALGQQVIAVVCCCCYTKLLIVYSHLRLGWGGMTFVLEIFFCAKLCFTSLLTSLNVFNFFSGWGDRLESEELLSLWLKKRS